MLGTTLLLRIREQRPPVPRIVALGWFRGSVAALRRARVPAFFSARRCTRPGSRRASGRFVPLRPAGVRSRRTRRWRFSVASSQESSHETGRDSRALGGTGRRFRVCAGFSLSGGPVGRSRLLGFAGHYSSGSAAGSRPFVQRLPATNAARRTRSVRPGRWRLGPDPRSSGPGAAVPGRPRGAVPAPAVRGLADPGAGSGRAVSPRSCGVSFSLRASPQHRNGSYPTVRGFRPAFFS